MSLRARQEDAEAAQERAVVRWAGDLNVSPFHRFQVSHARATWTIYEEKRPALTEMWMFHRYATEFGQFDSMRDAYAVAANAARARRRSEAYARPELVRVVYPKGVFSDALISELPRKLPHEWIQMIEEVQHEYRKDLNGKIYAAFHRVTDDMRVIVDVGVADGQRFL